MRTIYLNEELLKDLSLLHANGQLGCPYVFHPNGKQIKRITKERYNIVSDQDLKDAAKKIQTYHESVKAVTESFEISRHEVVPFTMAQNG